MKFSPLAAIASALVAAWGGACSLNGQGELPGASGASAPRDVLLDPTNPETPTGFSPPGEGTSAASPGAAAGGSTSGISPDGTESDFRPDASAHDGGVAGGGGGTTDPGNDAGVRGGADAAANAKATPDAESLGDAGPQPTASGGPADDAAD